MDFYTNYLDNLASTPNNQYRDDVQAILDSEWENSSTLRTIQEETIFGNFEFADIEVWMNGITEFITNTVKDEKDYRKAIFKDTTHEIGRGRYFKFDNNYWLTYEATSSINPSSDVSLRRCNNMAKWIDKTNGNIYEYPCVLDYTASSPSVQIADNIVTPNNHVVMYLQGNDTTHKIKKNQRFIFNGAPYKFTAYNNYMQNDYVTKDVPMLFMDLYLDIEQPSDDLDNNIANRYDYEYTLNVLQADSSQVIGFSSQLLAEVKYNDEIAYNEVIWSSNSFATVDQNGNYTLIGEVGDVAKITATLKGNVTVFDSVNITIVSSVVTKKEIIINPLISELKQGRSITFSANLYIDDVIQLDNVTVVSSGLANDNFTLVKNNNNFTLTNIKSSTTPLVLTFTSGTINEQISIMLKPAF